MKGSPMKRNFGIGASPVKQQKWGPTPAPKEETKEQMEETNKAFKKAFEKSKKKGAKKDFKRFEDMKPGDLGIWGEDAPTKNMKTGKYEHSFESPAKQKRKVDKANKATDKANTAQDEANAYLTTHGKKNEDGSYSLTADQMKKYNKLKKKSEKKSKKADKKRQKAMDAGATEEKSPMEMSDETGFSPLQQKFLHGLIDKYRKGREGRLQKKADRLKGKHTAATETYKREAADVTNFPKGEATEKGGRKFTGTKKQIKKDMKSYKREVKQANKAARKTKKLVKRHDKTMIKLGKTQQKMVNSGRFKRGDE